MLFNSLEFIFIFLPLATLIFYFARKKSFQLAIVILVLFSFFYYAYWKPPYLILLLGSIGINYGFASLINKTRNSSRRIALFVVILFNLALLFYFKYAGFFAENYMFFTDANIKIPSIILPIGISFFTFQQIAYQVDIYKGKVGSHNFWDYALFVSFFPQLIAGPIVHHQEMIPQFKRRSGHPFHIGHIAVGLTIFSIGLFKKTVIADNIAVYVGPIFNDALIGDEIDFYAAWIAALGYTFQLYFDFSGYSDMAVGVARIFGIRLPVNFFSPYKASSIIDFWRRWHMTLSRFFRDYMYIPMGGNRKGVPRQMTNLFLTMLLVGFWHGAGWTFIIWGGYHGVLILLNHLWRHCQKTKAESSIAAIIGSSALTFICVVVGWVFFRAESMLAAQAILSGMFGFNGLSLPVHFSQYGLLPSWLPATVSTAGAKITILIVLAMMIAFFLPNTTELMRKFRPVLYTRPDLPSWSLLSLKWQPTLIWGVFTALLLLWSVASILSGESEFLYYNF